MLSNLSPKISCSYSESQSLCNPTVCARACACAAEFWKLGVETQLTTVVLDGDVVGQQLVLASHTNEQRTSSPVGTAEWRSGRRERISVDTHTHTQLTVTRFLCCTLVEPRQFCLLTFSSDLTSTPFCYLHTRTSKPNICLLIKHLRHCAKSHMWCDS